MKSKPTRFWYGLHRGSTVLSIFLAMGFVPISIFAVEPDFPTISETKWVCKFSLNANAEDYKFDANGRFAVKLVGDSEDGWMAGAWKQSGNVVEIRCCDSYT